MRKCKAVIWIVALAAAGFGQVSTWVGGGGDNKWSDANNWSGGALPTTTSTVIIPNGFNGATQPLIDVSTTVSNLQVGTSGTGSASIEFGNQSLKLIITGNLTIDSASTFYDSCSYDSLLLSGNLTNLGKMQYSSAYPQTCWYGTLIFSSPYNDTISGNSISSTYVQYLVVNKAAVANTLVDLSGVSANYLSFTAGTWQESGWGLYVLYPGVTLSSGQAINIAGNASTRLWVPGGVTVAGGTLEISIPTDSCILGSATYNTGVTVTGGQVSLQGQGNMYYMSVTGGQVSLQGQYTIDEVLNLTAGTTTITDANLIFSSSNSPYYLYTTGVGDVITPQLNIGGTATCTVTSSTLQINNPNLNTSAATPAVSFTSSNIYLSGSTLLIGDGVSTTANATYGFQLTDATGIHLNRLVVQSSSNSGVIAGRNLTINNNITVDSGLTLTSGDIVTLSDTLTVGVAATVTRTGGMVLGTMRRMIPATPGMMSFDVGTANGFSPVSFTFPSGVTSTSGSITVHPYQSVSNNIIYANDSLMLKRFWSIRSSGLTFPTATASFTYDSVDFNTGVSIADTAGLVLGQYKFTGSYTFPTIVSHAFDDPTLNYGNITVSGITDFGATYSEFSIGKNTAAFVPSTAVKPVAANHAVGNEFTVRGSSLLYSLTAGAKVSIRLFNVQGRLIATLINSSQRAGAYSVKIPMNSIPAGSYIAKLDAGDVHYTRSFINTRM